MKTVILIFVLLVTTCLHSTIINVPADQPTIQDGIVAAADTDTVLVAEGTYFENINFIGKAITVASNFFISGDTLHIENTIINGSQPTNPDFGSVVTFVSNEDTTSVITGFTLTEGSGTLYPGSGYWGGGIRCDNSSPKVVSNIVTNNSADYTGGIAIVYDCSPILLNNVISYNIATIDIGGVTFWDNCNTYAEGNIISYNTANNGCGGILISDSSPTLVDNVIRENSAADEIGGVCIQGDSSPVILNNIICDNIAGTYTGGLEVLSGSGTSLTTIENCNIYGNTASSTAGGLRVFNATADVINCTISDNHAGTYGGGVFVTGNSSYVDFSYSSIISNSASFDGGGFEIYLSTPTITNCTIYGNEAPGCGSQIDCWSGGLEAANSIIGGNSTNGSVYFNTSTPTFDYCDFYNSNGPDFDGPQIPPGLGDIVDENANGDSCDVFMNIFLDPLFVDPVNDDFHLTEFSPCIDAGDPEPPFDPDGTIADIGRFYFDQTGIEENAIIQTEDYLHQNYPNPFNPETTINYQLPENGNVELTVYNLRGQKVKTLINETLESGNHTAIWNGTDGNGKPVSSGIYFYKLRTYYLEKTKRMILIK